MPIKSFFFPNQALQGEDIPSHITWSEIIFDSIIISHSENITLKEIYNVEEGNYEKNETSTIIKNVEVDGYLGLIFSSKLNPKKAVDEKIEFNIIKNGQVLEKKISEIHLFRPDIVLEETPKKIVVTKNMDNIENKIIVRNFGEGTAIVDIEIEDNSEIQKHTPSFIKDFVEDFKKGVNYTISHLKEDYPQYKGLLNGIKSILLSEHKLTQEYLDELTDFEKKFDIAVEENIEFAEALLNSISAIFERCRGFSNVYQFILDYIHSIGNEKILIKDPFNVIKITEKPVKFRAKIKCVDLLKQFCSPVSIPEITLVAKEETEIALFKLFEWGKTN